MRTPRPGQDFKFKFNLGVRCTPSLDIGARCVFLMQKGRVSRNAKRHWQSIPGRVPHFQARALEQPTGRPSSVRMHWHLEKTTKGILDFFKRC